MFEELGISGGTTIIILIVIYYIIKWAVKNGIKEAYKDITGKETAEEKEYNKYVAEIHKEDTKELEIKRKNKK